MKQTSAERIKLYILKKGLSKSAFYEASGLSNGFLDKTHNIGSDKIEKILKAYPDINLEWIITGKGEMLVKANKGYNTPGSEITVAAEPPAVYGSQKGIPLVPIEAFAGKGTGDFVVMEKDILENYYIPEFKKADFIIPVRGESMMPTYNSGDLVACKKQSKDAFIVWGSIYVIDTVNGVLIKRIHKGTSLSTWILRSDNAAFDDILIQPDTDVYTIARVLGGIRSEG